MVTTLVSYCDNHLMWEAQIVAEKEHVALLIATTSWGHCLKTPEETSHEKDLVWLWFDLPFHAALVLDQGNMPQRGIPTLWFRLGSQFCGTEPANLWRCSLPSPDILRSKGQQNTDTQSTRSAARSHSLTYLFKKVLSRCFYVLCDDPQKDHSWSSWKTYEACTGSRNSLVQLNGTRRIDGRGSKWRWSIIQHWFSVRL